LRISENRVLRIYTPVRNKGSEKWRNLSNKKLRNFDDTLLTILNQGGWDM
jgi:hypothetical protein